MAANVAAEGGHSGPGGHDVLIAHRIALDPTNVQRTCLAQAAGVARFSWNWALAEWRRQYAAHRADPSLPQPNEAALRRALNRRKRAEFPWMYDVTKCASQEAVIDLGMAFRAFFRKQARYPRFKQRGRARDSFCAANEAGTFRVEGKKIRLPKIGWVRMREELRFRGVAKRVTVSRAGERWYAAVTVEMPDPAPASPPGEAVGVDLGVTTLAVLSTGERIPGPKAYRRRLAALRRSSRALSRKRKGSANRRKAQVRLARVQARTANIRRDATHKATTRLARGWRRIVIEDLNVRGMAANRRLALSVMDGGFHEFRRQLAYKAAMVGSTVVLADRWYPSSKTCSCCGSVAAGLDLSQRIYRCSSCGLEIDRDLNAARNLEGLAASSAATACGGTRSGAPATRPRVGTGRVQRVPSKQEPDRNAPASGRGQPAQLYAEAGRCA